MKLSPSANLHFTISNKPMKEVDVQRYIQNNKEHKLSWLATKIKCLTPETGEYSILHTDLLKLLDILNIDMKRFDTLIHDRLYKLLNPEGCTFINDQHQIYTYGKNSKEGKFHDVESLRSLLMAQKHSELLVSCGKLQIYPENFINFITPRLVFSNKVWKKILKDVPASEFSVVTSTYKDKLISEAIVTYKAEMFGENALQLACSNAETKKLFTEKELTGIEKMLTLYLKQYNIVIQTERDKDPLISIIRKGNKAITDEDQHYITTVLAQNGFVSAELTASTCKR